MAAETHDTATALVERLTALEAHWGVRLASVSDRVRRPFTAALEQDELEALVDPAVRELTTKGPAVAAVRLETKAETFLGVASGSGVEVPEWLDRLGAAVDRGLEQVEAGVFDGTAATPTRLPDAIPWVAVSWDALTAAW